MIIKIDREGTIESFEKNINEILKDRNVKGIAVFTGQENNYPIDILNKKLNDIKITIMGGIFPVIIFGKEKMSKGAIFLGIYKEMNVHIIENLSDEKNKFDDIIDRTIPDNHVTKTAFILLDGCSKRISAFVEGLFSVFGLEFNYFGAGAGYSSLVSRPCLFTNKGFICDAAIISMLDVESSIGVAHGWKSISGPYKITESKGNVIKTLDFKPAFDVYRDIVEKHSGKKIDVTNPFEIFRCYPFGISKIGTEKLVRYIMQIQNDKSLLCGGDVPIGNFLYILSGDVNSLLAASQSAFNFACSYFNFMESDEKFILFADCIARASFLGNDFVKELEIISSKNIPVVGVLSLGEIANSRKDYLEFYNQTIIVGVMKTDGKPN